MGSGLRVHQKRLYQRYMKFVSASVKAFMEMGHRFVPIAASTSAAENERIIRRYDGYDSPEPLPYPAVKKVLKKAYNVRQ